MEKICGIYKITSPTGRVYIGESKDIYKRIYYYKILSCHSQKKLYKSLKKYGWDSHIFEVIEECKFDELLCRERYWQDFYNVLDGGLNLRLTECGSLKQTPSEETLEKMRVPRPHLRGDKSPNWKKYVTTETKEKLSMLQKERHKNNPQLSINAKKRMSGEKNRQYGVPIPEHQKQSIRESNSKIVVCLNTGIFYNSILEASIIYNIKYSTLRSMLNTKGECKNVTSLIHC